MSGRGSSAEAAMTYTAGTYGVVVGAGGGSRSQGGGYGHNGVQVLFDIDWWWLHNLNWWWWRWYGSK